VSCQMHRGHWPGPLPSSGTLGWWHPSFAARCGETRSLTEQPAGRCSAPSSRLGGIPYPTWLPPLVDATVATSPWPALWRRERWRRNPSAAMASRASPHAHIWPPPCRRLPSAGPSPSLLWPMPQCKGHHRRLASRTNLAGRLASQWKGEERERESV
jgi:hypothetical protein